MSEKTVSRPVNVVVIGGGYAGVMAANRLQGRPGTGVTLVNQRAKFVERIRLQQLAADRNPASTVALTSGATLAYDYLVYAVGSTGAVPAGVPGARKHAYPLGELEQAQRLRARLAEVPDSAPIVVVGGGLTGIEAASELAAAGECGDGVDGRLRCPEAGSRQRPGH